MVGPIPRVGTSLVLADRSCQLQARLGFRRNGLRVDPGLYAVGNPTGASDLLVTANYRLSFDALRCRLEGRELWILVLDTRGINVWCAAGKGSFGTTELIHRLRDCRLSELLDHREIVLPQLGAPGVAAHVVQRETGFRLRYGPVRAADLPAYLDGGKEATEDMRRVRFSFWDRLVLVPVEVKSWAGWALLLGLFFVGLEGFGVGGDVVAHLASVGPRALLLYLGAFVLGATVLPCLLPWFPGRAFSLKGALLGVGLFATAWGLGLLALVRSGSTAALAAWCLLFVSTCSFLAMQFTGCTPFTSVSGVRREVRLFAPLQALALLVALVLRIWGAGS